MRYNEETKKVLDQQMNKNPDVDDLGQIISTGDCLTVIAFRSYHLGMINGKQSERAKRAKGSGISKELSDFMRLFYQILEGKKDDMTVGELYAVKDKYGLSNEEVCAIFSL
jgi:hypothetical protein